MNDNLITVSYDSEQPTVLGRNLHEAWEWKEEVREYDQMYLSGH